ncbi:hypothetical protein PQQ51_33440 [Paraburkholderia xenovorans]|uniref:hypothetical protein n=1 Tax=Paraburkholderia xenovorans TaxID=36873 RepID=UPI0038BAA15E
MTAGVIKAVREDADKQEWPQLVDDLEPTSAIRLAKERKMSARQRLTASWTWQSSKAIFFDTSFALTRKFTRWENTVIQGRVKTAVASASHLVLY